MALARALKNEMRAAKPSKGDITKSRDVKTSPSKQYNFPKDTGAVGPHYLQERKGVSTKGVLK
jgi:hypothetical protein